MHKEEMAWKVAKGSSTPQYEEELCLWGTGFYNELQGIDSNLQNTTPGMHTTSFQWLGCPVQSAAIN